jgi:hypothetical protein
MLCQCLTNLCENPAYVEEQQQRVSDELLHEAQHQHEHTHSHDPLHHQHEHTHSNDPSHHHLYTNRSFQSILTLLSDCQLNDEVKAMTLKIYTILAIAEAEVHGETLETVHFHEVGRPQAILNMVGIAAALTTIAPAKVYCSKVIDGIGTVHCAHGEISIPVPAVRAMMNTSNLPFGTQEIKMEMVTPTGLAALLAMEPDYMVNQPEKTQLLTTAVAKGERGKIENRNLRGVVISTFN